MVVREHQKVERVVVADMKVLNPLRSVEEMMRKVIY